MGVTEIICSLRLVLDRKTGKEISESSRLKFLQKFLANNFALSEAEDNTSEPCNRGGREERSIEEYCIIEKRRFTLVENTTGNSQKVPSFWEVMDYFVLLEYASLAVPRTLFATPIARLSELYFRFSRFSLLVQTKKVISMNYGSSTSS